MAKISFLLHSFRLFMSLIIFDIGVDSSLRVDVVPQPYNEMVHGEINISCTTDASFHPANTVLTLQLERKGQKPIAVFSQQKLTEGPNMKSNMQAEGHIEEDSSHSYIKLTITNPTVDDLGAYTCVVFYIDDSFELNEDRTDFNVTADTTDLTTIVKHLMGKVTDLENSVQRQNITIQQQGEKLAKQEQSVRDYVGRIDSMETLVRHQQNLLLEQERQFAEFENRTSKYIEKDNVTSAFFVGNTYSGPLHSQQQLAFNSIIDNTGGDYNPDHGVYLAPVHGLYAFHLFAMAHGSGSKEIQIQIYVNELPVSVLLVEDGDSYDQSSVSAVASLRTGDTVRLTVFRASSSARLYGFPYTGFSGNLIKAVDEPPV